MNHVILFYILEVVHIPAGEFTTRTLVSEKINLFIVLKQDYHTSNICSYFEYNKYERIFTVRSVVGQTVSRIYIMQRPGRTTDVLRSLQGIFLLKFEKIKEKRK
jgi:hypothetical protein